MNFKDAALKHGYKSGLEESVVEQLKNLGIDGQYEKTKVQYYLPNKPHVYSADFILPNGIIVETKGWFKTADRMKHLYIKEQHPELDIRFVFSRPTDKISKSSKTSYAMWCDKHGFKWAKGLIPEDWINEIN